MTGSILSILSLTTLITYIQAVQFIIEPKKETCILEDVPINQVKPQPKFMTRFWPRISNWPLKLESNTLAILNHSNWNSFTWTTKEITSKHTLSEPNISVTYSSMKKVTPIPNPIILTSIRGTIVCMLQ